METPFQNLGELIERYLQDKMSDADREAFEEKIQSDPSLRQLVQEEKASKLLLEAYSNRSLKNLVDNLSDKKLKLEEKLASIKPTSIQKDQGVSFHVKPLQKQQNFRGRISPSPTQFGNSTGYRTKFHEIWEVSDLESVVNIAIKLGLPLLVTGESGTGKTRLARYVAEEMLQARLEVFNSKTTSKAKDLLYHYNALTHFRDFQKGAADINPMNYVVFEALGEAIVHGAKERYVVLIDEIDKAPRDFPNDVLF